MKSDRSHLSGSKRDRQFHLSISATQTDLFWKPCSARRQRSWLNSLSISQLVSLSPGYGCNDRRFCKAFELRLSCGGVPPGAEPSRCAYFESTACEFFTSACSPVEVRHISP